VFALRVAELATLLNAIRLILINSVNGEYLKMEIPKSLAFLGGEPQHIFS